jgi:hypothetical protein
MNKGSTIYPRHRLHTLEPYYSRHVSAMTELPGVQEGLHSKSDIAEQLAWRDQAIATLTAEVARLTSRNSFLEERIVSDRKERLGCTDEEARDLGAYLRNANAPALSRAELEREVATVRYFIDLTIAGGAHPSGAPQAISRIEAALGLKAGE